MPEQRELLLREDASRLSHKDAEQAKQHDYISIFGSQQDAIVAHGDLFTATDSTRTTTTSTTATATQAHHQETNSTMIQSLHSLIGQIAQPTTDDPTSIMMLRLENNSFVDGMVEMDDSGPNARDVSNAFSNGGSILNSFGA